MVKQWEPHFSILLRDVVATPTKSQGDRNAQLPSLSIVCRRDGRASSALVAGTQRRHDPQGLHRACGGLVQRTCADPSRLGFHPIRWLGEGR